jgi:mycothiol synthase
MVRVRVARTLSPHERRSVDEFLSDAAVRHGANLGDHLLADLVHGPRPGFIAALATVDDGPASRLVGYAQSSRGNDGSLVDVVAPTHPEIRWELLRSLMADLHDGEAVTWWSHDPVADRALADALGLAPHRSLLQLRRPLPLGDDVNAGRHALLRPFVVGTDEVAWLEVNNAAFDWHGEQGGWDLGTLEQREREPWFDPAGFLLHERDGRLAAFCWTKLHHELAGPVGEIYVVAVHPDFHGLGLGRSLTVAGLRHLHSVGATEGMLYVDGDNESAVGLYLSLGFQRAHTDQAYRRAPKGVDE